MISRRHFIGVSSLAAAGAASGCQAQEGSSSGSAGGMESSGRDLPPSIASLTSRADEVVLATTTSRADDQLVELAPSHHHVSRSLGVADRFAGRLQFGTAGLRAEVGAGPTRMNRLVVRQAAAGLAQYLLDVLFKVWCRF